MTPKEHLIESLISLCRREGGYQVVADNAKVSDQNLYQIINRKGKLPSGEPRGVGPKLQTKLDAAYPGWSGLGPVKPLPRRAEADDETLRRLGAMLSRVAPDRRTAVADNLRGWAMDGGADHWRAALLALLHEQPRKRSGSAG
jgi:hypothetical protein